MLEGTDSEVYSVAWSPDGATLASAAKDGSIRLWDAEAYAYLEDLETENIGEACCVAWSPYGSLLAVAADWGIIIWNATTKRCVFYHPLLQKPYPLDPARQRLAYIFPETKLQFLTLNSCWEIDQFHRTRASVHPDAVTRLINEADRQIQRAMVNTDVRPDDYLRIGVWHHPVADVERGIRNRELIDCWHDKRMHVIGAGSFGAKGMDLSEGSPRLYNVLEIDRDFSKIRVHTRQQPKPDGVWKGWNEWPMPDGREGGLPYFDIPLK